jgi:hypothetical protein
MCTVQMGSAHCASQASLARGSRPTWPFGPRPKSRGALAVRGGRGVGGGSPGAVHGGAARWGEVGDEGRDQWSPVVPKWSVMGYASERSSWRR